MRALLSYLLNTQLNFSEPSACWPGACLLLPAMRHPEAMDANVIGKALVPDAGIPEPEHPSSL